PAFAVEMLGPDMGRLLCLLYAEMRSGIPYAFEGRMDYLTILYELFLEIYNCFERAEKDVTEKFRQQEHIQPEGSRESAQDEQKGGVPQVKEIRDIIYWYASDYCDVFLADRILEQIDPDSSFAVDIIEHAD